MTESYALFLAIFYGKVILQKSYSHIPTIKLDTKIRDFTQITSDKISMAFSLISRIIMAKQVNLLQNTLQFTLLKRSLLHTELNPPLPLSHTNPNNHEIPTSSNSSLIPLFNFLPPASCNPRRSPRKLSTWHRFRQRHRLHPYKLQLNIVPRNMLLHSIPLRQHHPAGPRSACQRSHRRDAIQSQAHG